VRVTGPLVVVAQLRVESGDIKTISLHTIDIQALSASPTAESNFSKTVNSSESNAEHMGANLLP
jgi:hypothetical protein